MKLTESGLRLTWYLLACLLAVFTYFYGLDSQHIPKNGDEYPYEHIARLTADKNPALEWAYVRKVNLLRAEGGGAEAEELCRTKARTLSSSVLEEKVCDLLRADRRNKSAIESYRQLLDHTTGLYHKIRISAKLAAVYESDKQFELAAAQYEHVISLIPDPKNAIGYYRKAHDLAVAAGDNAKAKVLQTRLDELLKEPEKKSGN